MILQRIVVILGGSPEVGNEFFEIFLVFVSNLFYEESVLIGIELSHIIVRDTVHIIAQAAAVHVGAAIEYTGQRLVSEDAWVDLVATRVKLKMAFVCFNNVHHDRSDWKISLCKVIDMQRELLVFATI